MVFFSGVMGWSSPSRLKHFDVSVWIDGHLELWASFQVSVRWPASNDFDLLQHPIPGSQISQATQV